MRVRFWGTRGSIATPGSRTLEVAQRLIAAQLSPLQCFAAREGQRLEI